MAANLRSHPDLLALSAGDIGAVLKPRVCLDALREAYAALHSDTGARPSSVELRAARGTFHVKAGMEPGRREVLAAKLNANFPRNPEKGLPTIQGVLLLFDATNGTPLAMMDSGELTAWRTAAATALAAIHGACSQSRTATIIGCGRQAAHQLAAIADVLPLETIYAVDSAPDRSRAFAARQEGLLNLDILPVADPADATLASDVILTCTTASKPVLTPAMTRAGTFIAAVGADNPRKQELDPALFRGAAVIVDDFDACARNGELFHALEADAGTGRASTEEIVIYDSVGVGIQDVAVAKAAWRAAVANGKGVRLSLD
jgi:ornithine cyclodeaminase/alanine dehydrogenase-like protein (mu-crystallin family)